MKRNLKWYSICLLLIITVAVLFSCSEDPVKPHETGTGDATETTENLENDPNSLVLIDADGNSQYTIVYSSNCGETEKNAAAQLRNEIQRITNVRLDLAEDLNGNNDKEFEILVGKFPRDEVEELTSNFRYSDWTVSSIENKLYLVGGSEEATEYAVNYFIENYVSANGPVIFKPDDQKTERKEYPISSLKINGNPVPYNGNSFAIVYSELVDDVIVSEAKAIQAFLLKHYGAFLPMLKDTDAKAAGGFLLGQTSLEGDSATDERNQLSDGGFFIKSTGSFVIVSGKNNEATLLGLRAFMTDYLSMTGDNETYAGNPDVVFDQLSVVNNDFLTETNPCDPTEGDNDIIFEVNGGKVSDNIVDSVLDTLAEWDYKNTWLNADKPAQYFEVNHPFVQYVQFNLATGGMATRDLFTNPLDGSVMDDYNFAPLVKACRTVVEQGLTPWIKTGNVPIKYSKQALAYAQAVNNGQYTLNLYAPDDYQVYYRYIEAMAKALVDSFGLEEVQSWRWGVLSEYESGYLFRPDTNDGVANLEAYCKLYDYTTEALISVLGDNIYISSHSMTYVDGMFDETLFIEHCANGTNYCTGKKGSHLSALAISYFDPAPGELATMSITKCIDELRNKATSLGLTDLEYGVDFGIIQNGLDGRELHGYKVGWTYQAAYDAKMIMELLRQDIDYVASWAYTTDDIFNGLKTVSHHVANCLGKMVGSATVENTVKKTTDGKGCEYDLLSTYDAKTNQMYLMAYSYSKDVFSGESTNVRFELLLPGWEGKVKVTRYLVDDTSNFFDEWRGDYDKTAGSSALPFYSIDSAKIALNFDSTAYSKYSKLNTAIGTTEIENGTLSLDVALVGNAVVFYIVEPIVE